MLASIARNPIYTLTQLLEGPRVVHRVKVSLSTTLASTCCRFNSCRTLFVWLARITLVESELKFVQRFRNRWQSYVCMEQGKPLNSTTCNCVLKIARSIWIDCFTFTMFRSEANGCCSTEQARVHHQIVPKVETRLTVRRIQRSQ